MLPGAGKQDAHEQHNDQRRGPYRPQGCRGDRCGGRRQKVSLAHRAGWGPCRAEVGLAPQGPCPSSAIQILSCSLRRARGRSPAPQRTVQMVCGEMAVLRASWRRLAGGRSRYLPWRALGGVRGPGHILCYPAQSSLRSHCSSLQTRRTEVSCRPQGHMRSWSHGPRIGTRAPCTHSPTCSRKQAPWRQS